MSQRDITIIRSDRRKKTIQAKLQDEKLCILLPSGMTKVEEKKWIDKMIKKFEGRQQKKKLNSNGLLIKRAQELNNKYFDGALIFKIKYVTNQASRFGSCSTATNTIRISDRIADMPQWVRDYIIIHELAHLINADHSKKFWEKVNQFKYAERARGYLIAVGMLSDENE